MGSDKSLPSRSLSMRPSAYHISGLDNSFIANQARRGSKSYADLAQCIKASQASGGLPRYIGFIAVKSMTRADCSPLAISASMSARKFMASTMAVKSICLDAFSSSRSSSPSEHQPRLSMLAWRLLAVSAMLLKAESP